MILIAQEGFQVGPHPIAIAVVLGITFVAVVFIFLKILGLKKAVSEGTRLLEEGKLSEALKLFKQTACDSFGYPRGPFLTRYYQAVDGLDQAYKKANRIVDLDPIRQFQKDIEVFLYDKRYVKLMGGFTDEGEAIRKEIHRRFHEA